MRKHLSAKEVAKLTKRGRYAVGHGVYLQIAKGGSRSWIFRYLRNGRAHHVGLGGAAYISLSEARDQGFELKRRLIQGDDPMALRRSRRSGERESVASGPTFEQVARNYIGAHEVSWKGDASRKQWLQSLEKYAFPLIGSKPVANIGPADVVAVLDPIAKSVPVTAKRIRSRLALILDWAASRGLRSATDNPAQRKNLLPRGKGQGVEHFTAVDYRKLPALMVELRKQKDIRARCLEWLILTATRPNEAIGAKWDEIDLQGRVWTVPKARTKRNVEHKIPLSDAALKLLAGLPREVGSDFVFPGFRAGQALDRGALQALLRLMGHPGISAHGTARGGLKTWAGDVTHHPHHVVEQALAHTIPSAVERAYQRGTLFEKRKALIADWAQFLDGRAS